jgi:signal transduction histidine kinase
MTFNDIRDKWMRIATGDKRRNPESPKYGRTRTGAKGVGRFAARRLANKLTVYSVAETDSGRKEQVEVEFDWKNEFQDGQTLTDVEVNYQRREAREDEETGVILYLEDTRDEWDREDVNDLQKDLLTLVNPLADEEGSGVVETDQGDTEYPPDPGFSITIEAPEFPDYEGELEKKFLEGAWGHLSGKVTKDGGSKYKLNIRESGEALEFKLDNKDFNHLSGANCEIYYFIYSSNRLDEFDYGVRDAQRVGREQGGVRIYLDGFRVFPYGEPGNDWLELDQARGGRKKLLESEEFTTVERDSPHPRPYLKLPGNNQLFGAVEVSQSHLDINISRQNFVENEAFRDLKEFVQNGIYWMTIKYAGYNYSEKSETKGDKKSYDLIDEARSKIEAASTELSQEAADDSDRMDEVSQQLGDAEKTLSEAKQQSKKEREEHITERSMLRVLSAAGASVSVTNHQLRSAVNGLDAISEDLRQLQSTIPDEYEGAYSEVLTKVEDWQSDIESQVMLLDILLGREARERRRRYPVHEIVQKLFESFDLYISDHGVKVNNNVDKNAKTPPMYQAEITAVLQHAFTNSLKAVRDRSSSKIEVSGSRVEEGVEISIKDTGPGIEPKKREKVFEPFVTSSVPDIKLGVGTGLGLKVLRDIIESYGGKTYFSDPKDTRWDIVLEIFLPISD